MESQVDSVDVIAGDKVLYNAHSADNIHIEMSPASRRVVNNRHQLKTAINTRVNHLKGKIYRQIVYSLGRNLLCLTFLICLLVLLPHANNFNKKFLEGEGIVVILSMCLGAVGIPFQIYHIVGELKGNKPRTTLLRKMLQNPLHRSGFEEKLQERIASPPSFAIEIQLNSAAICLSEDPNHWSTTSRKIEKSFPYDEWMDESEPCSRVLDLSGRKYQWLFVVKSFFMDDDKTKELMNRDIAAFKQQTQYDKLKYFMSLEYILDLKEVDFFPDVEAFLIYTCDEESNMFYTLKCYKMFLFFCVDFVYHLIFHRLSGYSTNFYVVKIIKRN